MSDYTDTVDARLAEFESVAVGACGGCHECGLDEALCDNCKGTGEDPANPDDECDVCFGSGKRDWEQGDGTPEDASCSAGFCRHSCDACGSTGAGERYYAHGIVRDLEGEIEIFHLEVCEDCLALLANGTEPEEELGHE